MRLQIAVDEVYYVHFHHIKPSGWMGVMRNPFNPGDVQRYHGATACTVHKGECSKRQPGQPCRAEGAVMKYALCSEKDTFNKAVGRKQAFTRAIAHLGPTTRRQLWMQYLAADKRAIQTRKAA